MEPQRVLVSRDMPLRATVLVVDDDQATCELLSDWVRMLGLNVISAQSADQALALMRDTPVDVAFCDIVMPGHDGVWLIERIRREFPKTAVVIATGQTKMDPSVTLAPCVTGYLVKPFDFDQIASAVTAALAAIGATVPES